MKKEEFIRNQGKPWEYGHYVQVTPVEDALKAMDQYAKQEAIEFAAWTYESGYTCYYIDDKRFWEGRKRPGKLIRPPLTDDQLSTIYLQSKNKQ